MSMAARLEIWIPQEVARRLNEAMRTLHLLPKADGGGGGGSSMPDPITSLWEQELMWLDLTREERKERMQALNRTILSPTTEQITQMDEAIVWLYWLKDPRNQKVVSARAMGFSYGKISQKDGRTRQRLQQVWVESCEWLADMLNTPT